MQTYSHASTLAHTSVGAPTRTIPANTRRHQKFKHTSMQTHMSKNTEKRVDGYMHADIRYQHVCQHTHTHTLTCQHAKRSAQEHIYGY